jgi:ketosteroid isomerase-like protein
MARGLGSDAERGNMATVDVERVLAQLFVAIQAGDRAAIADLYADDIQVWHSATGRTVAKASSLAIHDWLMAPGVRHRYATIEHVVLDDRDARRHVLTVSIPGHDHLVRPVAIFLTITDGKIRRIDEYVDAKGTDRLIELIPLAS